MHVKWHFVNDSDDEDKIKIINYIIDPLDNKWLYFSQKVSTLKSHFFLEIDTSV